MNAASLQDLKQTIDAAMAELKSAETEKRQLELKAEHERQLIGLERKFQRQLTEARRKNEALIENLRWTQNISQSISNLFRRGKILFSGRFFKFVWIFPTFYDNFRFLSAKIIRSHLRRGGRAAQGSSR